MDEGVFHHYCRSTSVCINPLNLCGLQITTTETVYAHAATWKQIQTGTPDNLHFHTKLKIIQGVCTLYMHMD